MNKARLIEKIALIVFAAMLVVTAVLIPVISYNEHQKYVQETLANRPKPEVKQQLVAIEAELVEGKVYYANDKAQVSNEDVVVTAVYEKGEETIRETLDTDKYSVSVADSFPFSGGNITVSFKTFTTKIEVQLVPVVVVGLEIVTDPYTVLYRTGSKFSADGLTVAVNYNDGSQKIVAADKLTFDEDATLAKGNQKVQVSYTEGDVTKTIEVSVKVADSVVDGNLKSLELRGDAYVEAGTKLNNVIATILGVYESGNKIALDEDMYTFRSSGETAQMGRAYKVDVVYNDDENVTAAIPVTVRRSIEGESGLIVGGKKTTETEYFIVDGEYVAGGRVTFAGGFANSVKNGKEASVTYTFDSYVSGLASVTIRCANGNLRKDGDGYYMAPLQVNTVLDVTVNGVPYQIGNDVISAGISVRNDKYAPCYDVFSTFLFENIPLQAGQNTIKFTFKKSTKGETNSWGDSPSEFNIDKLYVDCEGSEVPDTSNVKEIRLSNFELTPGMEIASISPVVYGVFANGMTVCLDRNDYELTIEGLKAGEEYLGAGKYKVIVTLNSNPDLKLEEEYEVVFDGVKLMAADAEIYEEHKVSSSNYVRLGSSSTKSYDAENNKFTLGDTEQMILGLDWSSTAKNAKDGTKPKLTWTFNAVSGSFVLTMRINNSFVTRSGSGYTTSNYDLSEAITIKLNGVELQYRVDMPEMTSDNNGDLFDTMFVIELGDVQLVNGENTLEIEGNTACSLKNMWGETPAPRIQWINFETKQD